MDKYYIFNPYLLRDVLPDLQELKHVFVRLLIETSKDFSLRSVPQHDRVGPLDPDDGTFDSKGEEKSGMLSREESGGRLSREGSGGGSLSMEREDSFTRFGWREAVRVASASLPPSNLTAMANELVSRFDKMGRWEESEHPVVLFKMASPSMHDEVTGLEILALHRQHVDKFIHGELRLSLQQQVKYQESVC